MAAGTKSGVRADAQRLAALEEGYANLGREIGGLRVDFQQFAREVRTELGARSRTQWSPLIAAVAVVVTLVGAFASGPIGDIRRNDEALRQIQSNRFTSRDGDLVQAQLDKIWDRLERNDKSRFTNEEATEMRKELRAVFDSLHDEVTQLIREVYNRGEPRDVR